MRLAGRTVLDNIDLHVQAGQIVSLIGPNGAGKTTLVRILLGLLTNHGGTVQKAPGLRIGYMPQRLSPSLLLPLTVQRFLQLARFADHAAIDRLLDLLGIGHLAGQQVSSVSGGELQRVLLARALLGEPRLLILDEPAQGVDMAGQTELYRFIGEHRASTGCGVLMISHDLHLVMSATDEVICLNHHVCCRGKPEKVSHDPAFRALFGTTATESLAVYAHHHDHQHDLGGKVTT